MERDDVILAAVSAAASSPDRLTSDRIEALAAGHGMLNIPIFAVTNVLAEQVLNGADVRVRFANARRQPIDAVLERAIEAARAAGADGANAALISAVLVYLLGAQAQVGIPAGNRKLGATARMLAGVDRCGVAAVPTGKMNNKISGFPAVHAVYRAMLEGKLSPVSGRDLPAGVGGGPLYGHSALGEDLIYPAMAENGARIGTRAMLDALAGAGMPVHGFTAALLGSAAILEIIHPDANVAERYGPHGKRTSAYVAGCTAAATAGLPETLHVKLTGEALETGRLVGDLGLILKDIGGPSVIGMMALDEIVACFEEGIAGNAGGPVNPPLGHVGTDAVVALKALLAPDSARPDDAASPAERAERVGAALVAYRESTSLDPEIALVALNTVARKAASVRGGPVTDLLIAASEPARAHALARRARRAYAELDAGRSLADVVRGLEAERQAKVEARASARASRETGKTIQIRVTRLEPGARRRDGAAARYVAFDAHADVELCVDGETTRLLGVVHELIPQVATGARPDLAWAIELCAPVLSELLLAGNTIANVTVPAAVAAAMGRLEASAAAREAEAAATITAGIPGARARTEEVARLSQRIAQHAARARAAAPGAP